MVDIVEILARRVEEDLEQEGREGSFAAMRSGGRIYTLHFDESMTAWFKDEQQATD